MEALQRLWNIFKSLWNSIRSTVTDTPPEDVTAALTLSENILQQFTFVHPLMNRIIKFINFVRQAYQLVRGRINGSQPME